MLKIRIIDVYLAVVHNHIVHNHGLHILPLNGKAYYGSDGHNRNVDRQRDRTGLSSTFYDRLNACRPTT